MDTKQKKRAAEADRRRHQAPASGKTPPAPRQRRNTAAQSRQKRPAAPTEQRRSAERPQQLVRRSAPALQEPQRRAVTSANAEEMVFRPGQEQGRQNARTRTPEEKKRAEQRLKSAKRTKERAIEAEKAKKRPAVVYTQPTPLNLNRLLLQVAVVLAVVLAITMGLSVFFKVDKVVVYGNNAYSAWTIQEASGIENGERLLSINNARASGKIRTNLPYVDTVRIGIKLPDTVNIYVTEYDVAYAFEDQDSNWWLVTSDGRVVEEIALGNISSYTGILGVKLDSPQAGQQARALETAQPAVQSTEPDAATEETAPITVTGANRLDAALLIMQALETNDIVGEVASINVSSLNNIELWYGQRFQVKVGDTSAKEKKLDWMKKAVSQRSDYEMGILDISFTTFGNEVGYTPLE